MEKLSAFIYNGIFNNLIRSTLYSYPKKGDICSSIIKEELSKNKPSMIGRFGSSEIRGVLYPKMPFFIRPLIKKRIYFDMGMHAGFFPTNKETIERFSQLMFEDMKELDILASWRIEEIFLKKNFSTATRIDYKELEPYFQKNPWTEVLKDKKVLVIHPFNKTIESQYNNNRQFLFADERVLPEFKSLHTIKAVQTIGGNKDGFNDWFEALDYMKKEIEKVDFDIAILGCGAYGFSLSAHIKRIGKKSVYLGGATQILFGIKGKRWEMNKDFDNIINDYFVYASENDKPKNWSESKEILNIPDVGYW